MKAKQTLHSTLVHDTFDLFCKVSTMVNYKFIGLLSSLSVNIILMLI